MLYGGFVLEVVKYVLRGLDTGLVMLVVRKVA